MTSETVMRQRHLPAFNKSAGDESPASILASATSYSLGRDLLTGDTGAVANPAGLAASAHAGGNTWRDGSKIITEPEAPTIHCVHLTELHYFTHLHEFIVCHASRASVDFAVYRIIGQVACLEIAEMRLFLDSRFRELVKIIHFRRTILGTSTQHCRYPSECDALGAKP
ncbi:hypothetical protein H1R20_g9673, partial [Candolleomyces eurysporus]